MENSAKIVSLSQDNFDAVVDGSHILLIDFWSDSCAPCKIFEATIQKVAPDYPTVTFASANVAHMPDLVTAFNIRTVPFLTILKEGFCIYMESGQLPESTLRELLEQALEVDTSSLSQAVNQDDG